MKPPKEDGDTAAANRLRFAVSTGDIENVRAALQEWSDTEAKAALEIAARNGQAAILGVLLNHIDVIARHNLVVAKMVVKGTNLKPALPSEYKTALVAAASHGHAECARMLMEAGADPTAAMEAAVKAGDEDIALMACKAGGSIKTGETFNKHCMLRGMTRLLDHARDTYGLSVIDVYHENSYISAPPWPAPLRHLPDKSLIWLLENGMASEKFIRADLVEKPAFWEHAFAQKRLTPDMVFRHGIGYGTETTVRFALAHGADINALGPGIVLKNIQKREQAIVSLLLEKGIDLTGQADACLVACIEEGSSHFPLALQLLEKHGADVNAGNGTPLLASMKWTDDSMFHKLLELGANVQLQPDAYLEKAGQDDSGKKLLLLNLHGLSLKTRAPEILKNNLTNANSLIFMLALREAPMEALKLCLEKDTFPFEVMRYFEMQARDGTMNAKDALVILHAHGFNSKNPEQQKLAGLIAACGEDVSGFPDVMLSSADKKALIAKGVESPGYFPWPGNHWQRLRHLFSSQRPAVKIPENTAPETMNDWQAGILRARNATTDMERACKKGSMKAFLRMMAANAEKLADLSETYVLSSPQTCADLHTKAKSWRQLAGTSAALDGATENAAAFAEPEILYKTALALKSGQERASAMSLLVDHATLYSLVTETMQETLRKDSENLKSSIIIATDEENRKLERLTARLDTIPATHIAPKSLETLKAIAARDGTSKALETLGLMPQSFDIHFMGRRTGRFRPWVWLRKKFHADAWHNSLKDYKNHLQTWQAEDPDGSFGLLREILDITEKTHRLATPLIQQQAQDEKGAAFFADVVKASRAVEPFIFSLAKAQGQPSHKNRCLPEIFETEEGPENITSTPRPPTLERQ
ncbi:MAG TPA: hypothetical protein DCW68_02325 [Rhodospirillaceae bacterium]|nr:MAG: hypothetical protein A2018_05295 [Alphaproteobacteria bacterium GWF2_58_20]HAU28930.1 hypothetical protein [Rhodospirillaceae bacterium]